MFTTSESIIISNLIALKSISCWTSFMSNETMFEHLIKSNELKIDSKFCLDWFESENTNSTTLLISTTLRLIFMNRILNQIATSDTLFSMIDIQDLLHSMINITCIRCYFFNSFMRILSFVNMNIIIINLNHQHQWFLFRFVHLSLHQSVNHLKHFALKISTHVRSLYLTISSRISMHAHHRDLSFHLEIWHHMSRHRSYFESQRVSSRNCRNWTKFIRSMRNSRIQTIILTSNWESFSINVNVSNYHYIRTWKKRHSCLRNVHCFIFMIINTRTSHSTNFVTIRRNALKNQNESVSIRRNDNSCTSTTSLLLIRICLWLNVFKSYVLISMTFKKSWILIITIRIKCEKF
jgi:hypothetical protein